LVKITQPWLNVPFPGLRPVDCAENAGYYEHFRGGIEQHLHDCDLFSGIEVYTTKVHATEKIPEFYEFLETHTIRTSSLL
jgi:hypothetical protein